ncbi:MAG: hypothetical protein MUO82_11840 [Candidatus Thermoplasmatota archaeon]|nr:hypothetical protein [Candidatus Thermoplasmatota archaeon]
MCQIKTIKEMGVDDASLKIKKNFGNVLRISGIFLFIQETRKFKTKKIFSQNKDSQDLPSPTMSDLKPGDLVRVRSKEQILKTLDSNNKLDGCFFMDEMWQYCRSQHKILKKVNYFFDERGAKMYKTRNIVLLEDVHCSGKQGNLMPRCDRNCYVFWKEDWLEKI